MRRKWYMGLGAVLLLVGIFLVSLHDYIFFEIILVLLIGLAIYDRLQTRHAILRNFPVLGHIRFVLEFFRPEIQQYFIADDRSEMPFSRKSRTVVYSRAKSELDTIAFGTVQDLRAPGYEWALHSLAPKEVPMSALRVAVGGPGCSKPYLASRLNISALSYGALSDNAIKALNQGAKIGGFAHNTGEGGLTEYHLQGGDLIWQLGTAYFGCRDAEGRFDPVEFEKEARREEVKMIEIKLSQGAKPSHGGILPAKKVTPEIARIRKVALGQDVLSPPAHSAFSTPEGLLQFVQRLRELSGGKPVGFKLCVGIKREFFSICKAMLSTGILPDFITVDGAEGGTGAAPLEFADHLGAPLDGALSFVHSALRGIGVRRHVRLIASGKVATGFDMITKMALGADLCNVGRGMMLALGCLQSLQCNANTCPVGVATQDKRLAHGLVVKEKRVRVANFHQNTLKSFAEMLGAMGLETPDNLPPNLLRRRIAQEGAKSFGDIYPILAEGALLVPDAVLPGKIGQYWAEASAQRF